MLSGDVRKHAIKYTHLGMCVFFRGDMVVAAANRAFDLSVESLPALSTSCDPKCLIEFVLVHEEYYT